MGAGKEKKEIQRNSAEQRDIAGRQREVGEEQLGIGREGLDRQNSIYDLLLPYITNLLEAGDSGNAQFPDIKRPDMSAQIRRDYMDDLAQIEGGKNAEVAGFDDYATASGLGRSGIRGSGLGAIVRGAQDQTGTARRNFQQANRNETLAGYEDQRDLALRKINDARQVAGMGINAAQGQQAVFNPVPYMSMGSNNMGASAGTLGQSSQGYQSSAQLPSAWSTVGGIVGRGLGMASQFAAPGSGGLSGLRNIWSGAK